MRGLFVTAVALAASVLTLPASGAVVYSNLGSGVGHTTGYTQIFNNGNNLAAAVSFVPTANFALDAVMIPIEQDSAVGAVGLQLMADNGGTPGSLLEDLGAQAGTLSSAYLTYTSTGSALSANTTYWLVARGTSGVTAYWNVTNGSATGFLFDAGLGWMAAPYATPAFSVEGTLQPTAAVPLPAAAWMGLIALPLAGCVGRRRRA